MLTRLERSLAGMASAAGLPGGRRPWIKGRHIEASLPLARSGLKALMVIAVLATALSVGLQGFFFGVINNSYHIPIVENWMGDAQFAHDQFIQSLRFHTSYVWPIARWIAGFIGIYQTFIFLHVANRFAMFAGMALLVRELGVRSLPGLAAAVATLAVTRYLLAASGPGDHDLFMPFLNHSSLTWPFLFASWLFLLRRQVLPALALQGPVFAVNAFVAICGAPAVAAAAVLLPVADRKTLLVRCVGGILAAGVIAAPTVVWIGASFVDQPTAAPFSFLGFLHQYYENHWFISAAAPRRLVSFVLVTGSGAACLAASGPGARSLLHVWIGYLVLFAAGVALPFLADNRALLDLHPMRVGAGCLVMLSTIALVSWLARVLEGAASRAAQAAAGLALLGFAVGQAGLVVTALVVAVLTGAQAIARTTARPGGGRARFAGLAVRLGQGLAPAASRGPPPSATLAMVAAGLLAVAGWRALRDPAPYDLAVLSDARETGLWIRHNTPLGAMIFLPSGAVDRADDPVSVWTRRPLWYDWKEGAAVMWSPQYYGEWSTRRRETSELNTVRAGISYACMRPIDYVVETTRRLDQPGIASFVRRAIVFSDATYTVLRVAPLCAAES